MKKTYILSLMISAVATAIGSGAMGTLITPIVNSYSLDSSQEAYICVLRGNCGRNGSYENAGERYFIKKYFKERKKKSYEEILQF